MYIDIMPSFFIQVRWRDSSINWQGWRFC